MGTFRYYKASEKMKNKWEILWAGIIASSIFACSLFHSSIEDRCEQGNMWNNTYLFYNYHTKIANQPYKETFKRE